MSSILSPPLSLRAASLSIEVRGWQSPILSALTPRPTHTQSHS
jgi:hypothetical protein